MSFCTQRKWSSARRQVLKSIGSTCITAGLVSATVRAAADVSASHKMAPGTIDVHSHMFPPALEDISAQALAALASATLVQWRPSALLEAMDRNGVQRSVISTSWRPSMLQLDRERVRTLARQTNDYGARLHQDHPDRISQWGFVPLPDVDGTLAEIGYCLDTLKAPGIGLMTSYGDRWIGDPSFRPVLEELHRRKAVVFCHPLPAQCCTKLMPSISPLEGNLLEFPYDTGRAMVSLLLSGGFAQFSDIRWIFCHCGGVLPALSGRVRTHIGFMPPDEVAKFAPNGVDHEFRRQYFDTADAAYAPALSALRAYVSDEQILFGTDFPYVLIDSNVGEIQQRALPKKTMAAIQRDNILKVLPQLA